jgi:transposase InsO family protein
LRPDQFIEVAGFEMAGGQDARVYRKFGHISIASIERIRFNRDFLESVREAARQDGDYEALRRKALTKDDRVNPNPDELANPNPDDRANPYTIEDGVLYYKHRLVVPQSMRETVLKAEHDSKVAGHWGAGKTVEIVSRNFYWPGMEAQVRQYVHECDSCQRNKPSRHRRNGLLHPLELPSLPWSSISMDFITDLPESEGCQTIWVVVDRFTRMAHFVGLKEKTAAAVARQFVNHIWKPHGLPDDIVSDRDTAFTSKFWKEVMNFLGIKQRMSTAFHPQTDGQTERVNQVLEAYLREYCSYEQDDWMELLPLAEYAYNNSFSTATGLSPFYANYGYHARTNSPTAEAPRNPGSELYTHWLQAVHQQAVERLQKTRERIAKYWDSDKREGPHFQKGDYVMLDGRHIKTKRACKKLDAKLYGPFRILSVGKRLVKLELPPHWRIHPTFHISLIEPYRGDPHRATTNPIDIKADDEGWTPEAIVAAGPEDDNPAHHKFLVKWQGFSNEENTWEEFDHMFDIALDLVRAYYRERPHITPDERLPRERPSRAGLRRSTRRQDG